MINSWLQYITLTGIILIIFAFSPKELNSQTNQKKISNGWDATLNALPESLPGALGYPSRSLKVDISEGFRNPPKGYGQVPFFWWTGDKLTPKRLEWELNKLHSAGIQGFTVAYNHSHSSVDKELNGVLKGQYGRTDPGDPPIFSDEWWEIWKWFSEECGKREMGLGLKDYTFNLSGYWHDEIRNLPEFKNYQGRINIHKIAEVNGDELFKATIKNEKIQSFMAYRVAGSESIIIADAIDLLALKENNVINWIAPEGTKWHIYKSTTSNDEAYMLHPDHGKEHINKYFKQFESRLDSTEFKGLNYFFQDELGPPASEVGIGTWSEDFPEQFLMRKGYDIIPYLPALVANCGAITSKVRLDYFDVFVSLAEERFYKPIFDWHWQRGLIYGADNWGRGLNPLAYGDYFRITRWFTAPGNDAPGRGESFIQTKTSASIAHLYQRPRVWLEAFHSIGWDARPDELIEQIDKHFQFGGNFLNLHGLYYTLHGGWWEWAPPCFHFRMPYWAHFKHLVKYTERLSYLCSQGVHEADVAIVYPVSPMQVDNKKTPKIAFEVGEKLFNSGIDFIFIDYQSLARTEVDNEYLNIAESKYKVLVLADLPYVRFSTLSQALKHFQSGGIVLAAGELPFASDRFGSDDPELNKIVKELFGVTAEEARDGCIVSPQRNDKGGLGWYFNDTSELVTALSGEIVPDFISPSGKGKVMHRRVGCKDIYMVMNAPLGEECFFRSKGKAELWNARNGEITELPVSKVTEDGSFVCIPISPPRSSIIVFSPGQPDLETEVLPQVETQLFETINLDSIWDCRFFPTMDNRWGDFRLPVSYDTIGVEVRELQYKSFKKSDIESLKSIRNENEWSTVRYSFGPQMQKVFADSETNFDDFVNAAKISLFDNEIVKLESKEFVWEPYCFSWRWGVLDEPGSQGWHGLKEKVDNGYIILDDNGHFAFRTTLVVEEDTKAKIFIEGEKPQIIFLDGKLIDKDVIKLKKGTHRLFFAYKDIQGRGKEPKYIIHRIDDRPRSAVVFVSNKKDFQTETSLQELAMKWYNYPGLIHFDYYDNNLMVGNYRFLSSPGFRGMHFKAYGDVKCWVDGKQVVLQKSKINKGFYKYNLELDKTYEASVWIEFRIEHFPGFYGGNAFPESIKIFTGKGKITVGDWSKKGILKHYSGGVQYNQKVNFSMSQVQGKMEIDLGEVIATCELFINSKSVGVLINSPFTIDISPYVISGENDVKVIVYNTLSNHYQTIPSAYKGNPISGLLGPVKININYN